MFKRSGLSIVGAGLLAGVTLLVAACGQPVRIGPTQQPWGQTPEITPVFPDAPGLRELPPGFKPCGDYTVQVKLDDGTTVNVRICVYCSENPNDRTVYVQQDCAGNYRPGQRNPAPGQRSQPPASKPLGMIAGNLTPKESEIYFTVEEDFTINPKMLKGASAQMVIDGADVSTLAANGPLHFDAGTKVMIKGDNVGVADLLFWNFGAGEMEAVTDLGNQIRFDVVHTPQTGANVIVRIDGEYMPQLGGMLPWRGE